MELQDWLFVVSATAAVGQVGALIALIYQLKDFRKQTHLSAKATRDSTRSTVWLEMLAIDRFFCDHPELREQFYGPSEILPDPKRAQQAEAMAEMLLDFAECMMTQKEHLDGGFDGWADYFQTLFSKSAVLRKFWQENHHWFQEDLQEVINGIVWDVSETASKRRTGSRQKP